jgi:transposase InsO family protein
MSRKGNCWDKAVTESFFKTLKTASVYTSIFKNQQEARITIFKYIEIFYNRQRLHSAIGYRSAAEMEKLLNQYQLVA